MLILWVWKKEFRHKLYDSDENAKVKSQKKKKEKTKVIS